MKQQAFSCIMGEEWEGAKEYVTAGERAVLPGGSPGEKPLRSPFALVFLPLEKGRGGQIFPPERKEYCHERKFFCNTGKDY